MPKNKEGGLVGVVVDGVVEGAGKGDE